MDPFCNELPGLLLESLHHYNLDVFVCSESLAFQCSLEWAELKKVMQ
jgi:hypothetical protein